MEKVVELVEVWVEVKIGIIVEVEKVDNFNFSLVCVK